ncbi:transcriptional regulator, partial [Klebsiella pneumoniae]
MLEPYIVRGYSVSIAHVGRSGPLT